MSDVTHDPAPTKPTTFRSGGLSPRKPTHFAYAPDAAARAELARSLDLLAIKTLTFTGSITPSGRDEMTLTGTLTASVDQACVVSLVPVPARITEQVRRRYVAGLPVPEGEEMEMPEDDATEPMPEVIDLAEVTTEALALALPLYPRAPGATLGEAVFADAGVKPLADADLKPFAGLAGLAEKLGAKPSDGTDGGA
jgi:uncharacterized metal-binding protein YceD (DUF177 family)